MFRDIGYFWRHVDILQLLQGDLNQNCAFLKAITTIKLCISDPIMVKPKCVSEAVVLFNFRKFVYIFQLFVNIFKKKETTASQHILALPTWGQKCLVSELQPLAKSNFDLGHPVEVQKLRLFKTHFSFTNTRFKMHCFKLQPLTYI